MLLITLIVLSLSLQVKSLSPYISAKRLHSRSNSQQQRQQRYTSAQRRRGKSNRCTLSMRNDDTKSKIIRQEATPFLTALTHIRSTVPHQFFFPGHSSGKFIPDLLKEEIFSRTSSPFEFDLPELDGLDNVHNPEVSHLKS